MVSVQQHSRLDTTPMKVSLAAVRELLFSLQAVIALTFKAAASISALTIN